MPRRDIHPDLSDRRLPPGLNDPRIPILGSPQRPLEGPNNPGLTANCDIHDSEIAKIQEILEILRRRSEGSVDYDAFDREIRDRFNTIGFKVSVAWWRTNVEGTLIPEITITDRTERVDFDHEQKVHEIVNDVLDLGDGGVIKYDPSQMTKHTHHH